MTTSDKRTPAYTDLNFMPFGKYKDRILQDVPAGYLLWLWTQKPLTDKLLENYIWNSMDALKQEHPDYTK